MPQLKAGTLIHVKADHLPYFFSKLLPLVTVPVILVSGDSDYGGVRDFFPELQDDRLAHWFAQNCEINGNFAKLTRLPIGLDNPVFTKFEKRIGQILVNFRQRLPLFNWSQNERGNQALLRQAMAHMPAVADKPVRVFCTFDDLFMRLRAHAFPAIQRSVP